MVPDPKQDMIALHRMRDGSVRIEIHAEVCDQGCGERVRYWNDDGAADGSGNASCGCCNEGPEACDPIVMFPQVRDLLCDALAELDVSRRRAVARKVAVTAKDETK